MRDALDAILARSGEDPLSDMPKTIAQRLALSLINDALGGDKDARAEVIDRTDGKAIQAIEHSGEVEMIGSTAERRKAEDAIADGLVTKLDSQ